MENLEMDTNTTETPQVDTVSAPKPKRTYKKKEKVQEIATQAIPVAPIRTAAMDRLEAEILEIVSKRSAANDALRNAKFTAEQAQLQLKNAQEFLFSLEQEVNYRMTLLGQLKGNGTVGTGLGAVIPQNPYTSAPANNPWDAIYSAPPQPQQYGTTQVSSAPPAGIEVVGGRKVRSEDAVAMRAML